jgi:hypothetical protein
MSTEKVRFAHIVSIGIFALALSVIVGCQQNSTPSAQAIVPGCFGPSPEGPCEFYHVSLVQLIANPQLYDGKRVLVGGYIHLEFEGNGLYINQDDFRFQMYANGVWIQLAPGFKADSCQDSYVTLRGTFLAGSRGHMGLWSGSIEDVRDCGRSDERV